MEPANPKPKRRKPQNPIELAITAWLHSTPPMQQPQERLIAEGPRRWTVYEPMVLLPAGSFSFKSSTWQALLSSLPVSSVNDLWIRILAEISKSAGGTALTHLAVNEGIPAALQGASKRDNDASDTENILRSPTGLRILHGNFGPSAVDESETAPGFETAIWVSTRQNGVFQTWAPRWTMFSRGNIKEKARLLDFHNDRPAKVKDAWAVDMYAGIGYFTFSYAKLGMRVLCWELNPWSVEGLRRGALGNGWSVRIVRSETDLGLPMEELVGGGERIIVFLEDNRHAARRIRELRELDMNILHVNCGLLPTSEASWKDVWEIATRSKGDETWLHLHENVGVADISRRKEEIKHYFLDLASKDVSNKTAHVEHAEQVKTFAPGVWHCVFDLYITRSSSIT
ncbi:hypothetical protein M426DRAFT_15050 [Hypoxylon sp. CI-4A]|nr:hypothetical protein M426DRAFT_15050 [Hypoxylon sp. CI-4A]